MKRIFTITLWVVMAVFAAHAQQDTVTVDTADGYSEFLVPDYESLGKIITDPSSRFYYPSLLKRFAEADTSLTIEEIHCLYYGYVLQKDYDPYIRLDEEDQARDILNRDKVTKKDAQKALNLLNRAVEKAPMHVRLYMYRHYANSLVYGEDSKQVYDDAFRYVALIGAIASSGDGTSFETALHVAIVSHSYNLMNYYGLSPQSQALQSNEGRQFDVFPLEENEFELDELYVDVTPCLNYLSRVFASQDDDVIDYAPVDQFDIRVGRKLTIALDKKHKGAYKFRIVKYENCTDTVDWSSGAADKLFPADGEKNTIVFYCVNGKMAGTDCILLIMKSFCKEILDYDTFIRLDGSAEFQTTSNTGILPGVLGTEIWKDPVNAIRISRLRPNK